MSGEFSVDVIYLSLPLGFLIAASLWVNEFPDYHADLGAGKYNLVARLGKRRAAQLLPLIYLLGFAVLVALPALRDLPEAIYFGLLAVPAAAAAVYWVWRDPEEFHRHKPAQAAIPRAPPGGWFLVAEPRSTLP
jgi:1,4-dihydroxy-2-naphthoate octaprenyltransferase